MENTASWNKTLDHFTQGYGCIQVHSAFEYTSKYSDDSDLRIDLKIPKGRGVYLRNISDFSGPKEYTVTAEPFFH